MIIRPVTFAIVDAFDRDSLHTESHHTTKIIELPPDALGSIVTLIVYLLDVSCSDALYALVIALVVKHVQTEIKI